MAGAREVVSKFEEESGSRRSMFMVRQFAVAIVVEGGARWRSCRWANFGGVDNLVCGRYSSFKGYAADVIE